MKRLSKDEYKIAADIVKRGGLIAFPTETVFGLGVIYNNISSYNRLIEVKRRPPEKPFTLMCADVSDIYKYAVVNDIAEKLIKHFMPGQFTIILKAKEGLPSYVVSKEGNVGIRISADNIVTTLIREVGSPMLVPSANKSGEPPLTKANDVYNVFKDEVDAMIEGESTSNTPSTIVLVDDKIHIIRLGLISEEEINKVVEEKI